MIRYRSESAGAAADEKEEEPPKEEAKEEPKGKQEVGKDGKPVFVFVEGKLRTGFERPVTRLAGTHPESWGAPKTPSGKGPKLRLREDLNFSKVDPYYAVLTAGGVRNHSTIFSNTDKHVYLVRC